MFRCCIYFSTHMESLKNTPYGPVASISLIWSDETSRAWHRASGKHQSIQASVSGGQKKGVLTISTQQIIRE